MVSLLFFPPVLLSLFKTGCGQPAQGHTSLLLLTASQDFFIQVELLSCPLTGGTAGGCICGSRQCLTSLPLSTKPWLMTFV